MNSFLDDLNPKQREAVLTTEGPVLILAGPGSGKTKTLTSRITHLLMQGVRPENILAVTFTNKAAAEMKERINRLLSSISDQPAGHLSLSGLFIGTFHSLAVRILRDNASAIGYLRHFTIFDEDDSLSLLKEVMKELEINPKQYPPGMVINAISKLKNELMTPERYEEEANLADPFPKTVHRVWEIYQKRIKNSNAMDFDDLILNACLLFKNKPEILKKYQGYFLYINVDEYQDVNQAQYTFVTELAKNHRNIAVVGDDAQAIYGFRGADYRNILNFEKDWPDAKIVVLDQNYRSTQMILDAAGEIIGKNKQQKEKRLWTQRGEGEHIRLVPAGNERAEARIVVEKIQDFKKQGFKFSEMAVLYRTNAQSRVIEETFLDGNVPYKLIGGVRFYQRKEVKDILAYTRFLLNPQDLLSLKRIINVPPRGIGKQALLKYLEKNISEKSAHQGRKAGLEATENFETLVSQLKEKISQYQASAFIKYLLSAIKYQDYLEDSADNAEERWENVQELVNLSRRYDELPSPEGLQKLLEDVALMSEAEDDKKIEQDSVTLLTLHAAKGLEFPIVFIIGLEEGIFPHSRSLFSPHELEEERRLMFVGLTRAKDKLFLSFAMRRVHFGSIQANPPSRFLSEIPEHLLVLEEEGMEEIIID